MRQRDADSAVLEVDVDLEETPELAGAAKCDERNALWAYIKEIDRYSLLTREQEQALGWLILETGNRKAARKLFCANLRLV